MIVALALVATGLARAARSRSGLVYALTGSLSRASRRSPRSSPSPRARRTGSRSRVLGASFAIRAIGDAGPHWLSWLSPLGWGQAVRAYGDERWWVLLLLLALAAR